MKLKNSNVNNVRSALEEYGEIKNEVVSVLGILFNQVFKKYPDFEYSRYDETDFMDIFYSELDNKIPISSVLDLFTPYIFEFNPIIDKTDRIYMSFSAMQIVNDINGIKSQETYISKYYYVPYAAFSNTEIYVKELLAFIESKTDTVESLKDENEKLRKEIEELKNTNKGTYLDDYKKHSWRDVSPLTNPTFPYAPPYSIPAPYYGPGFTYPPQYTHLNGTPISYCFTHQP